MAVEFSAGHLAYLAYPHYAVVATLSSAGAPQLSTVWYDLTDDQQSLMFVIERDSLKARNLQRDPRISISVPNGGRYLVMDGEAQYDLTQSLEAAQQDLERIGRRYYGPVEGAKQVAAFGSKPRLTIYLGPAKIHGVGIG